MITLKKKIINNNNNNNNNASSITEGQGVPLIVPFAYYDVGGLIIASGV